MNLSRSVHDNKQNNQKLLSFFLIGYNYWPQGGTASKFFEHLQGNGADDTYCISWWYANASENTAFYDKVHNGRCPKWLTWENCIMFNLICHTESKEISLVILPKPFKSFKQFLNTFLMSPDHYPVEKNIICCYVLKHGSWFELVLSWSWAGPELVIRWLWAGPELELVA